MLGWISLPMQVNILRGETEESFPLRKHMELFSHRAINIASNMRVVE